MSADDGPGQREIAYRVFAAEYDDSTVEHKESDEERAPNYVVSPTGARMNRLFVVGVLTEVEQVNEDTKRARVVDPTGAFVVYAGQYQPDAVTALERVDAPAFVAVTGKANTFSPEDSDRVFTSLRPESINEVDAGTRDRWTVTTAEHTLARVATMADALGREERGTDLRATLEAEGVEPGVAAGVPLAIDHYGTTPGYLAAVRDLAVDAAEVVADERGEVRPLSLSPDDRGTESVDLAALAAGPDSGLTGGEGTAEPAAAATGGTADAAEATATGTGGSAAADSTDGAAADDDAASASSEATSADTGTATETGSDLDTATESEPEAETAESEPETVESEPETAEPEAPTAGATDDGSAEPAATAGGGLDADEETNGAGDGEDLGDFEPGGLGDEDGEMYEMDEEEREQVKEEHGVEFSTGNEVSDPGEADIETPDPEESAEADEAADPAETESADVADASADEETTEATEAGSTADADAADDTASDDAAADDEPAADADPADVLMDVMRDLDDGDGAPRDELVAAVADRTGADEAAVDDAIQDALMGGQCYESGEDRLTPI